MSTSTEPVSWQVNLPAWLSSSTCLALHRDLRGVIPEMAYAVVLVVVVCVMHVRHREN